MKLVIADDHTLFRDALIQYIQRNESNAVIKQAESFYDVETILENGFVPDLVLLDLRMPGMNGLQGMRQLRISHPTLHLSLMSGLAEDNDINEAINIGAVAYFPKTMSGKSLLKAIHSVLDGDRFFPKSAVIQESFMPSYKSDDDQDKAINTEYRNSQGQKLSKREQDVAPLLQEGLTNKEIAERLNIQIVTVKLHIRSICQKLEVKNRTQAALKLAAS